MRKILSTIALTTLAILPLQADLQMTLMDKDGTEIKQCIKSYSFSNNLESIAKQKGVAQDVYSEEETLTNKVFMGKPVYRKIVTVDITAIKDGKYHSVPYQNPPSNMEYFLDANQVGKDMNVYQYYISSGGRYAYEFTSTGMVYAYGTNNSGSRLNFKVVLEYTKTTDVITTPTTFKSYIHYIPSSSTTNEVITKDLENKGVIIDKNYTYDASTDSCTAVLN
ncbi:hypothetical protein [Arcobacter sp.]|uniref:hypothetical protein n=1 Tax=Arcobacter sp. TaxID=1872629 RepID=UPI003D0A1CCE